MHQLNIAILFGGCSEEHDISIKSAMEIAKQLNKEDYNSYFIGISREGDWRLLGKPESFTKDCGVPAIISPSKEDHGLIVLKDNHYEILPIDVVFPILHGKMGEDGEIQGLLEASGIPYVGCGIMASVIGMDKSFTHLVAAHAGVKTPDFQIVHSVSEAESLKISYPVFVKPACSGSSFGVNKVTDASALSPAITEALKYGSKVLIEEAISGCEVGCSILGEGDNVIIGEVDQITCSTGFFKIHQESHPENGSENATITVPAPLSQETCSKIKNTALTIYKAMGCQGLSRVDLFLQETGEIVLNEVNTMPGCTCYSRYPQMMKAAGFSMEYVVKHLITLALQRK